MMTNEEIAELAKHGIYAQTVFCVCEWIDGHPIKLAEAYTKDRAIEIAQKLGTDRIKEGDE